MGFQRPAPGERIRERTRKWKMRGRNEAGPQPSRPAGTPLAGPSLVRVRNTDEGSRNNDGQQDSWATFAKRSRLGAVPPVSQSELARRLETDRTTIWRWEHGKQKPDAPDIVVRFAMALNIDPDEALAAAGFKPGIIPPAEPTRDYDEDFRRVMAADVDEDTRRLALEQLELMRQRDIQRRADDIEFFLRRWRRGTA